MIIRNNGNLDNIILSKQNSAASGETKEESELIKPELNSNPKEAERADKEFIDQEITNKSLVARAMLAPYEQRNLPFQNILTAISVLQERHSGDSLSQAKMQKFLEKYKSNQKSFQGMDLSGLDLSGLVFKRAKF